MTSFNIINDDVGLRKLLEDNKTPVVSGPVRPVNASKPVQPSPENIQLKPGRTERREPESQDFQRRQADRRKTDSDVLLDTRSQHDRRTKSGRKNDELTTLRGIDVTI